ncbi:MAG: ribbon-helix-helix protein, CopG family [Coriobacteriia bacterium]|nr:ribbon-helix-helix protein, CopG family [Coriobacteriia bacterium]
MEYITASGKTLTDEDIRKMDEEAETGNWHGDGPVVMGRPKMYDEDLETVSFRLPQSRIAAVEAVSKRIGESKSEFFRRAIDQALLAAAD